MIINIKPLSFKERVYSINDILSLEQLKFSNLFYVDTDSIYIEREDNKMKDYIIIHWEKDEVGIVVKKSIQAIRKGSDSTVIYTNGNTLYVIDKYEDIIKQYLA